MNLFLQFEEDFVHVCHFLVMLFKNLNLPVNLDNFLVILVVQISVEGQTENCCLNLVFQSFISHLQHHIDELLIALLIILTVLAISTFIKLFH